MAYATKEYTASSVTTDTVFTTPEYLSDRPQDITVYVDNVAQTKDTHYSITGTQVKFLAGYIPTDNKKIRIVRSTHASSRLVDYQDGTKLKADTLDKDSNQMFFLAQEAIDEASSVQISASGFYTVSSSTPANPSEGDLWLDTSALTSVLKVYCKVNNSLVWKDVTQSVTLSNDVVGAYNLSADGNNKLLSTPLTKDQFSEGLVFLNGVLLTPSDDHGIGKQGSFGTSSLNADYYFQEFEHTTLSPFNASNYNAPFLVIKDMWDSSANAYATGFSDYDNLVIIGYKSLQQEATTDKLVLAGVTKAQAIGSGVSITGDLSVTGNVDGVDIAALNTTVASKANTASPTFTGNVSTDGDISTTGTGAKITAEKLNINSGKLFVDNANNFQIKMGGYGHGDFFGLDGATNSSQYSLSVGSQGKILEDYRYATFKISGNAFLNLNTTPKVLLSAVSTKYIIVEDILFYVDAGSNRGTGSGGFDVTSFGAKCYSVGLFQNSNNTGGFTAFGGLDRAMLHSSNGDYIQYHDAPVQSPLMKVLPSRDLCLYSPLTNMNITDVSNAPDGIHYIKIKYRFVDNGADFSANPSLITVS